MLPKLGPGLWRPSVAVLAGLLVACSPRKPAESFKSSKERRSFPACQLRSVTHRSLPGPDEVTEAQIGTNGVLRLRTTTGVKGQRDLITDGQRLVLRNEQGRYEEAHGEAAALWARWQREFKPDVSRVNRGDALLVGQEEVAGQAASVYRWTEEAHPGGPQEVRVWIANVGFQPLKLEVRRERAAPQATGATVSQTTTTTYGYDPTVEVTLPPP